MCEEAIRYKPSIPKHVEPVNNKIKDEITKPILSMINEYLLVAESLHHENKMKVFYYCTTLSEIAVAKLPIIGYDKMRPKAII
ncbi:hypothetical protein Tco_1536929, partial [Tanacetum coccineum]